MSTAITHAESFPADVIVRAFAGEPVHLKARGYVADDVVEVVGSDETKAIGFPAGDVYRFDSSLYGLLRAAYESGQAERLRTAWGNADRLF